MAAAGPVEDVAAWPNNMLSSDRRPTPTSPLLLRMAVRVKSAVDRDRWFGMLPGYKPTMEAYRKWMLRLAPGEVMLAAAYSHLHLPNGEDSAQHSSHVRRAAAMARTDGRSDLSFARKHPQPSREVRQCRQTSSSDLDRPGLERATEVIG